ncbi:M23 family metallopeptidase [Prosthecomicrobium pneumaticum]|uniref:Murein DD-endopeptidase MepM/ murein hydrolase activator NlpD n=1 Tax=Prosthecomicrobium pneumaticum TaxID=81895 RepID=A0A7W9FP27_9HYPH|nr:M23 family metallopeptidase [Prosthecomicrobium pneumaticum]MBB5754156.1 murein DD-endopeptidase MepM/ murein hydrolase activator NlpD [Prosthecomicrobium pneumaticum]
MASAGRRIAPHRLVLGQGGAIRGFSVRSWVPVALAGAGLAIAVLYLGATSYLVFHGDLAATRVTEESRLRSAYERKLAAMKTEIDHTKNRAATSQAALDEKMDRLLGRQDALGERQRLLSSLTGAAKKAGIEIPPTPTPRPVAKGDRMSKTLDAEALRIRTASAAGDDAEGAMAARLEALDGDLDRMEGEQLALVEALTKRVAGRATRIASALSGLGVKLPREEGVGGPFVPLDENALPFHESVDILSDQLERFAALRRLALALPLRRPLGNAEMTSRFGARLDPFLGRPAFHAGVDFRAPSGTPVRAVAAGKVVKAEWEGGYGRMVEIDHGRGISTRYGHMSSISVSVGDRVEAGAAVGAVGSTGRSTGPHLHYEVRVGGEAVDPVRYLDAAQKVAGLL